MAGNYTHPHPHPHPHEKENKYYKCCESQFFFHIILIAMIVLFAGMMSGLTLGLMSMSLVDLEVLAKSGKPGDRRHASKIFSVVKRQHLVLCTLLISNAAAMEALPIFLDNLIPEWGAILLSVTLILLFGEIIPQSVCSRYGLVIGSAMAPIVRVLVWIWFPVAYPISKVLDFLLGKEHVALFRRAELKTLVDFHGNKAGKGGELSHEETTIIAGALELTEKTAKDAMTPISEIFSIDINGKLNRDLMNLILEMGHSRIPVYYDQPRNIIGVLLVKNLMTINPADGVPIKNITIRRIPRVSSTMPLYDILHEFQKGLSHMAVVIQQQQPQTEMAGHSHSSNKHSSEVREVRVNIHGESHRQSEGIRSRRSLNKLKGVPGYANVSHRETSKSRRWSDKLHLEVLNIHDNPLSTLIEQGDVIGIITMDDVMEELLKEEIYDETDHRNE